MPIYVGMTVGVGDELPAAVARASIARRTLEEVVFIEDDGRTVPPIARNDDYIRIVPWSICLTDIAEASRYVPLKSRAAAVWDTDMESEDFESEGLESEGLEDEYVEPPVRPQDSVLIFGHRRHDATPVSDAEIARLPFNWNEANPVAETPAKIMRFVPPLLPPWRAGKVHPQATLWRAELDKAITTNFLPRKLFDASIESGQLHADFHNAVESYSPEEGGRLRRTSRGKSKQTRDDSLDGPLPTREKIRDAARTPAKIGLTTIAVTGTVGPDAVRSALAAAEEKAVPLVVVFTDAFPQPPGIADSTARRWFSRTDFFRVSDCEGRVICVGLRNIPTVRNFSRAFGLEYTTGRRDREGDFGDDATMTRALRECGIRVTDWTVRDGESRPLGPAGPFKGN